MTVMPEENESRAVHGLGAGADSVQSILTNNVKMLNILLPTFSSCGVEKGIVGIMERMLHDNGQL